MDKRRLAAVMVVLATGFGLGIAGLMPVPEVQVAWSVPAVESRQYVPGSAGAGEEILLVYMGSSSCHWSNAPGLASTVRQLKLDIQRRVRSDGLTFATLGIARDRSVVTGMKHLRKFGAFDEVTAGHGWYNDGVRRYVYEELPGPASTPQVIVVRRTLGTEGDQRLVANEQVLVRKVGLSEILEWAEAGAPLPPIAAESMRPLEARRDEYAFPGGSGP